jgi:hypothetical protein
MARRALHVTGVLRSQCEWIRGRNWAPALTGVVIFGLTWGIAVLAAPGSVSCGCMTISALC